jgi:sRNA-binding protein
MSNTTKTHPALVPLAEALGHLPPVFTAETPLPLAIGISEALAAVLVTAGQSPEDAAQLVRRALGRWTRAPQYLHAVAGDCAGRYDLEGNRVADVLPEHGLAAALNLHTLALRDAVRAGVRVPDRVRVESLPGNAEPAAKQAPTPAPAKTAPTPAKPGPLITVKRRSGQ